MHAEFVAVDWGTTHRRVFHVGAGGMVLAQRSDDRGVLAIGSGGGDFAGEIAALRAQTGDVPLLLAGMIGSTRGWTEVPYVAAPAGLAAIVGGIAHMPDNVFIVPGVMVDDDKRPDVMRGEEVQILGAHAMGKVPDGLVCLPGTHTKWAEISLGEIMRFRTVMTGDILAALKAGSILSDLLQNEPADDAVFLEGVDHALDMPDLNAELFSVRARVVTRRMTPADAASRISGLLIGADVRIGLGRERADVVTIIGAADLCQRFALALQRAGRESFCIDGDQAFLAGAVAIMAALAGAPR
ncbi:MFS transporter [Polymorphobacter glacialis]|uniref:MFS transporter n=1 Tax=Sandarakinorhabdus glacialis TaxID=1614636 RepID=A0A916ZQ95_9SPHN|nr:2-dehydro-3-deoxygalactonokinase [Polymorphobacter glacialis]GGE08690.1 MFS transporter [Polymorphobacter glacialis]